MSDESLAEKFDALAVRFRDCVVEAMGGDAVPLLSLAPEETELFGTMADDMGDAVAKLEYIISGLELLADANEARGKTSLAAAQRTSLVAPLRYVLRDLAWLGITPEGTGGVH